VCWIAKTITSVTPDADTSNTAAPMGRKAQNCNGNDQTDHGRSYHQRDRGQGTVVLDPAQGPARGG